MRLVIVVFLISLIPSFASAQDTPVTFAVFTFENLTSSQKHDWVSTGFAEAITDKLKNAQSAYAQDRRGVADLLRVSKIDTKQLKAKNAAEIQKLIGCDYLIFGSVQSAGDVNEESAPLRVTARVVKTATGVVSRGIEVDGEMKDLFELQTRLALLLSDEIGLELSQTERSSMSYHGTGSLAAYRRYVEGLQHLDAQEYDQAIAALKEANELHPGILYAEAHHALGQTYLRSGRKQQMLTEFKKDAADLAPIWFNLGKAYHRNGEYGKASEAFATFLRYTDRQFSPWRYGGSPQATIEDDPGDSNTLTLVEADGVVHLLDMKSGALRWRKRLSDQPTQVTYWNGIFYFGTQDGFLHAVNSLDATEIWRVQLEAPVQGKIHILPEQERLVVPLTTGRLLQFNAKDGAEIWRTQLVRPALAMESDGLVVFVGDAKGELRRLDQKGVDVWTYRLSASPERIVSNGDLLLVASSDGTLVGLDKKTGEVVWKKAVGQDGLVCLGAAGAIYAQNGTIAAIKPDGDILWEASFSLRNPLGVWLKDRMILCEKGSSKLLIVNAASGDIVHRMQLRSPVERLIERRNLLLVQTKGGELQAYRISSELEEATDREGYLLMGDTLREAGRFTEAQRAYEHVVFQLDPYSLRALYGLAEVFDSSGQNDRADSIRQRIRLLLQPSDDE